MDFFKKLRKKAASELIEIIEWLDDSDDTLVFRFPVDDQEIKMGAQLTVRENQLALFINEGQAADLFQPGRHVLTSRNIPILTTVRGWKYGFHSPFKAEVYFFNTKLFADLKWGTSQPVLMRDKEFGMVRLRAFGTYAFRIADAKTLFTSLVGTQGLTTTDEITGQLRSILVTRFSDAVAESAIAALDLSSNYDELSVLCKNIADPEFAGFGLELSRFFIENISVPEDVQAAIDQKSRLGVLGGSMDDYMRLQAAEALTMAAQSSGGAAGAGVGLGAGVALGQTMGQALQPPPPPGGGAAPAPPAAGAAAVWTVTMQGRNHGPYTQEALRAMVDQGKVTALTLAWKPGAAGWAPLESYAEFSDMTPPPPPPPANRK
ncbi:MAG: SPFH domain-containing protein [Acidobacteriota bacterium]